MKIGIVGTGNMGKVLGALWAELGHQVFFGARDPAKARAAAALAGPSAGAGGNDEAARFGDLVYFNPRDVPVRAVLSRPESLDGKIVVESHNGPMPPPFELVDVRRSRSELLQAEIPAARVVKAFNTMAQEVFEACPHDVVAARISAFVASDHEDARRTVLALVAEMGLVPIDCGALRSARQLESLGDLVRSLILTRGDVRVSLSVQTAPAGRARFGPRLPSALP